MWRFSLASSQALPGDIIFSLDLHFKFARDVGNEPIQEPDGEEHKVLEDDDETKSDSEDEEILTIEIVWLNRVKVLLVPGKRKMLNQSVTRATGQTLYHWATGDSWELGHITRFKCDKPPMHKINTRIS